VNGVERPERDRTGVLVLPMSISVSQLFRLVPSKLSKARQSFGIFGVRSYSTDNDETRNDQENELAVGVEDFAACRHAPNAADAESWTLQHITLTI